MMLSIEYMGQLLNRTYKITQSKVGELIDINCREILEIEIRSIAKVVMERML